MRPWDAYYYVALALASWCFGCLAPARPGAPSRAPAPYFREWALSHPGSGPAILAVDEDDAVWVALARDGKIARWSNGHVTLFPFPSDARPVGIAIARRNGPEAGAIWVAASYDNKLARFDIATHKVRTFALPGDNNWPFNVAVASDGGVWFTQRFSGQVGRLDPTTGAVKNYSTSNRSCGPAGLAIDRSTGKVWFTEGFTDTVAALDPVTGHIQEWRLSDTSSGVISGPAGIAVDGEGGVWFAKLEGKLGHLGPGAAEVETIAVPAAARRPAGIAVAPNGAVWTLALDGNLALRYDPARRAFTEFPLPTGSPDEEPSTPPLARTARPFGLGFDRQGNLWLSEQYTGQLAALDLAPPTVEIVWPVGAVEGGRTLLTTRVSDAVSGVAQVAVAVDAAPLVISQGGFETIGLLPGRHRLTVTATDGAGLSRTAETSFDYRPGRGALRYAIERLQPTGDRGARAKHQMLDAVEALGVTDLREGLAALQQQINRCLAL